MRQLVNLDLIWIWGRVGWSLLDVELKYCATKNVGLLRRDLGAA
jgi:hypothetical protein